MKNKPLVVFLVVLGLLFIGSIYQFFATHERKEITKYTAFKGEAKDNPLFAARLFLNEMGIPAINKNDLQSTFFGTQQLFPDTNTVIILDTNRSTLSADKIEQLLDWVNEGGHLITRAIVDWDLANYLQEDESYECTETSGENEEEGQQGEQEKHAIECLYSSDPLQSTLDITVDKRIFLDSEKDENPENDDDYDFKSEDDYNITGWMRDNQHREYSVGLANAPKDLTLTTNSSFYAINSDHESEFKLLIEDETFLIQRAVGNGLITLISELDIIENQLLRNTDNAEIFWYLIHSHHEKPANVWLFHNNEMPNLLSLIWKYGWTVILSLAGLLLFWLFQSAQRFGPLIPKQAIARRRLMEHVDASGQYFWKMKNKQLLIDSTRKALNQRIGQLHPAWQNTDEMGQVDHLAEMLDIPINRIKHLLFNNQIETDEDFTELITELESIRRNL